MLVNIRHLLRSLRRSPASAAAAVLALSLTLGAGASIFAVVDAVLLTPPPFNDPDDLVHLGEILPGDPLSAPRAVTYATFEAWRARVTSIADLEGVNGTHLTLTGVGAAERVHVSDVTPRFLPLLQVAPARGRMFVDHELGQPLVLLTDAFWRAKFAADPAAVGRQIVLGGRAHTIVGVLPEQFAFPLDEVDVFRPLPLSLDDPQARANFRVGVLARLARNGSVTDLTAALDDISRRSSPPAHVLARPLAVAIARGATKPLALLAGAAALAFLVALASLAGLLLVRSIDRRRELAVRMALGASPFEVCRQLVLEAATLVVCGVVGGALLAMVLTPVVSRLALQQYSTVLASHDVTVSWRVIGVLAIAAAVCTAVCGLLPARFASRSTVTDVLSRGVTPAVREVGMRRAFVTGVVAMTCVLLVCVSVVGRSLRSLLEIDAGFDARGVLAVTLLVQNSSAGRESLLSALHSALEERLGRRTVSVINELPATHDGGRRFLRLRPDDPPVETVLREAGADYFDVMRIPIVAGRSFDARDDAAAPARVVVSESLAKRWFAGQQSIGRQIRLGQSTVAPMAEIIGIVGDVKHAGLDAEKTWPTVYQSAWQSASGSMSLVIRSQHPDPVVIAAVREELARLSPDVPISAVRSMSDVVAGSPGLPVRRVLTAAFVGFASLALVLAGIGLFGVVTHDVASRRPELALRLALGADPTHILLRTIRDGALMVGAGLVVGGILSIWAARALGSVLFMSGSFDPFNVALAAAVLMTVGAISVVPGARRAARTDPANALRGE